MSRFIIDTNIIIMHPEILSRKLKTIIPDVVMEELRVFTSKNKDYNNIFEIIQSNTNSIHIAKTNINEIDFEAISLAFPRLSKNDMLIANLAKEYAVSHTGEEIYLVTQDKLLQMYCKQIVVKTLDLNEIRNEFVHVQKNEDVEKKVNKLNEVVMRSLILNILIGVLSSIIANILFSHSKDIFGKINIWGTIVLVPLVGVLLYYLRSKFRLFYGITESLIGVSTSLRVFIPSFNYSSIHTSELFQILGGLYIIVRGMDNIGKGLENTKFYFHWRKVFER